MIAQLSITYLFILLPAQVLLLMAAGGDELDIRRRDAFQYTPLMYAALSGNPTIVRLFVERYVSTSVSVDELNPAGMTPLLMACRCGNFCSAYVILTVGGAETQLRDNEFFMTAHEWARSGWNPGNATRSCSGPPPPPPPLPYGPAEIYDPFPGHCCRHARRRAPALSCWDEVMQGLPELFRRFLEPDFCRGGEAELTIGGRDALDVLLETIDDIACRPRLHPYRLTRLPPICDEAPTGACYDFAVSTLVACRRRCLSLTCTAIAAACQAAEAAASAAPDDAASTAGAAPASVKVKPASTAAAPIASPAAGNAKVAAPPPAATEDGFADGNEAPVDVPSGGCGPLDMPHPPPTPRLIALLPHPYQPMVPDLHCIFHYYLPCLKTEVVPACPCTWEELTTLPPLDNGDFKEPEAPNQPKP